MPSCTPFGQKARVFVTKCATPFRQTVTQIDRNIEANRQTCSAHTGGQPDIHTHTHSLSHTHTSQRREKEAGIHTVRQRNTRTQREKETSRDIVTET